MMPLKTFRNTAAGVIDLLNWALLVDDGIVQNKDGSFLAGYYYTGPDTSGATDNERGALRDQVNQALARFGAGWTCWVECCRQSVQGYQAAELSHFPDPVSRLIDAERRAHFVAPDRHHASSYVIVLQFTPPTRRKSRVNDLVYDDDPEHKTPPASRLLAQFKKKLEEFEDAISNAIRLDRMVSYVVKDRNQVEHYRDELVNFLHYTLTGEDIELDLPFEGGYLDAVLCSRELYTGDVPRLGDDFITCVTLEAFPSESYPGILETLNVLGIPFRWSSRFIFLDQHESRAEFNRYRKKWNQAVTNILQKVFRKDSTKVDEDALKMVGEADRSLAETNSGLVAFGYYSLVVVLMHPDRAILTENARLVARTIRHSHGFETRVETINTIEAWLGTLPGHSLPNIRRPLIHTEHLANLMPLTSLWTGLPNNPCPMYPPGAPALLLAETSGSTPVNVNLHVGDSAGTIIVGPPGSGKTALLATVAVQALRYADAVVWCFDFKRGMLATVKACGGQHYDIARGPTFAPLAELDDETDLPWAAGYVADLFELQTGRQPTPLQRDAIYRALSLLQNDRTPGARSMGAFMTAVQDQDIRDAIHFYTVQGGSGGMLDADADSIAYGRFMVFEMEDLLALPVQISTPVLLHLFRRGDKMLRGQPTFMLLDELSMLMQSPMLLARIPDFVRVNRSKNAATVMATQFLSDLHRSGILDVLFEACPTKIYLPNAEAETGGSENSPGPRDFYLATGLNDRKIGIIRHAVRKRDYYLAQPDGSSLVQLALGPIALAFAGATSQDDIRSVRECERQHGAQWPFVWLKQRGVKYEHLMPAIERHATMQHAAE